MEFSKAVLVRPTLTAWNGEVVDKVTAHAAEATNGAVRGSVKVKKVLLPGATGSELKYLWSMLNDTRTYIYDRTLRWINKGELLLPLALFLELSETCNEKELQTKKFFHDVFLPAYPTRKEEARPLLDKLYVPEEYPTAGELIDRFQFRIRYFPVPEATALTDLVGDNEAAETANAIAAGYKDAMNDAYERLRKAVEHAYNKLSDEKAVFRDSLLGNLQELADILPKLNVTNDPRMNELIEQLKPLTEHDPETVRNSPWARSETASRARALLDNMGVTL